MTYDYWKAALAGEKPKMFVDTPELGFYRKGVYERNDKGNNRRVGWLPVAVYVSNNIMFGRVGEKDIAGDSLNDLWSSIADNPISEETYRAVAERGEPWPDAHDPSKNKPVTHPVPEGATAASPENVLATQINEASAGVSQYDKIDSDEMSGRALSLKNTITSLAGDLDKHREALVRPHVDAQREINNRLNPIIKGARITASTLLTRIGTWEDTKREAAKAAVESGEKPNAPAPSVQVAAAVGRRASVKVKKFVTMIDIDKAFAYFRNEEWLYDALLKRAQGAVDAGLPVPGAVTEERSVVR